MIQDKPSPGATPDPATGATLPQDPIIAAARRVVVDLFATVADQLPDLVKAQTPADNPIPQFTDEMIDQLKARLNNALGLPPDDKASPK